MMTSNNFKNTKSQFLVFWATIGGSHESVTSGNKLPSQWGKERNGVAYAAITPDLCRCRKHYYPAGWQTTNGMSMRECVCVRDKGKRGVLCCVEMRGKANILHHVPSHTFPRWFGLFKSCCQWCLSASLSLCLGLRELYNPFDTETNCSRWN